jgi:hypothetical protein
MEVLARALHVRDAQLQPTLDAIVSAAASALNAGRDAGLILLERGKLVPRAATGRAPLYLDLQQQQAGEGPCIESARRQIVIRIDDTRSDPRWPGFMVEAREHGVLSQLAEQMRAAVVNRDLIGQAKGILMERHRITADAAFALLAKASQHKNVKLTEVAACLVETGELIG